jgi:glucose/arabinose dehydrogenase
VQRSGVVRQFSNVANATASSGFIDITARVDSSSTETGLLGMAFHPGFPADPRVFLSYTATVSGQLVSRISAFTTADSGQTLNANSEQVLLTVNQPERNHNGGHLTFGRDGYLYIGFGDGGGSGDVHGSNGNGQNLNTLLGKLLRIDIGSNGAATYSIPGSNPYAANAKCPAAGGSAPCPELYAWGFRNPWRFSFDRQTTELWAGDVGQDAWEEINQVQLGGNYGWRCREAAHVYNSSGCGGAYIDPVAEYDRGLGYSVTGGYVYRGTQLTPLLGRYLFADYGSGNIFAWLPQQATAPRAPTRLLASGRSIASFGEANNGELYVVDYANGRVYRLNF